MGRPGINSSRVWTLFTSSDPIQLCEIEADMTIHRFIRKWYQLRMDRLPLKDRP